ncbi:hypothetical protein BKA56DRAFT_580711, partial [Ilyonectria sp. MPI-CAGE-AT-0026]
GTQTLSWDETNIQLWRHAAIAISRRHLQQAKFKRDFTEMAAHSTKLAGLTYTRGLKRCQKLGLHASMKSPCAT